MLKGELTVIAGCMFCGKTEELIRLVHRAKIARKKVRVFKSVLDARYSKNNVVSHNLKDIEAIPVSSPADIDSLLTPEDEIIAIDEVQFFDRSIIDYIEKWINKEDRKVIAAGLNQDSKGRPFGPISDLLAIADDIISVTA